MFRSFAAALALLVAPAIAVSQSAPMQGFDSADGNLRLSVPGQPTYTLLADSPTRFRLTGPQGMPAGFFAEFQMENGMAKTLTLIQPQGTLQLQRKER